MASPKLGSWNRLSAWHLASQETDEAWPNSSAFSWKATAVAYWEHAALAVSCPSWQRGFSAFEDTLASCFVPKCWVGFLSVVRILSFLECMRAVMASFAGFSHELSGHYRIETNVEHEPRSVVWVLR